MERIAGHYDKIILTLIMCLVILFMATFSPFAQSAKAVVGVDDAIIAIIVAALAACGITFVTTSAFDSLNEYVSSLIDEYALENNTTGTSLLSGVQSGTNKLGQILINNRFVLFIDTFARWLIAKFNLTNSSSYTPVSQGNYIGQQMVYDRLYAKYNPTGNDYDGYYTWSGSDIYAVPIFRGNNDRLGFILVSFREFNTTVYEYHRSSNGNVTYTATAHMASYPLSNGIYVADGIDGSLTDGHYTDVRSFSPVALLSYPSVTNYQGYVPLDYKATQTETWQALILGNGVTWNPTEIDINVDNLNLPIDNEDYDDGKGAIIDVGASWGSTYDDVTEEVIPDAFSDSKEGTATIEYAIEEEITEAVEDTADITNLPAGTIPFTPLQLPNLQLSSIWHYVAQWIADTAIAAGSLMAIVIQEPSPMVNLFYATVCLAIIFGVIKGVAK